MNGRLGTADLVAGVSQDVYSCPAGYAVATVTVVNRAITECNIKIAVSSSVSPNPEDYIEWQTVIPGKGHIERTGVSLEAGKSIIVESDSDNVNCVVWGSEVGT